MIEIKNELIEWIENVFDLEILQQVRALKHEVTSSSMISDINAETILENNFDEQFAAGMTSDELLENVAAHMESMNLEKTISLVSDPKSESAVKDDLKIGLPEVNS